MKSVWIATLPGICVIAVAPAAAQEASQDPVGQGIAAWERGDYEAAVALWRGPANTGNSDAQFNLGQAYKLGRGVPTDMKIAEEWYRKAALQGHPAAEDNYGLAMFQNGKSAEAVWWLERSARRGEQRAQFILGTMYFNGDAVEKDWVRAYGLMVLAAQKGLPQASTALAQMDKYIPLEERQQGIELARTYEQKE